MKKIVVIVVALLLPIALFFGYAQAATQTTNKDVGQALSITPSIMELKADPGQSLTATIKIRNDITTDLLIRNSTQDFTSSDSLDEQGVPKLIDNKLEPGPHSIRNYVEPVSDFLLKGKETKTIQLKINVPKDAQPGAHYGAILFTGEPASGQNVTIHATLGNLLFLNVSGNTKDDLSVIKYFTSDNNSNQTWFFENGPILLNQWIKNTGNTVVSPSGRIEITNIFGQKVADIPFNTITNNREQNKFVLPETTRKFNQKWDKYWLLGPYNAHLILNYGSQGKTFTDQTISFWVIPWKLILLILVITAITIWLISRGHKSYKKTIIKKDRAKRS